MIIKGSSKGVYASRVTSHSTVCSECSCCQPRKHLLCVTLLWGLSSEDKQRQIRMTLSNWNISCVTCPLWGEFTGHRWIPLTKAITRSFDVFFGLRLNKQLCKQSRRWWVEKPSGPLWRHCNVHQILHQWCYKLQRLCDIFIGTLV